MKKQTFELRFLSDRFLKWVKINFTLTPIIPLTPIIVIKPNAHNNKVEVVMRKETSCLSLATNERYPSRTMGFVPQSIQCSATYRVVILFLIITVLSSPAYSEAIKNPDCDASAITTMINDIDMKDKEETGEIDTVEVSKIAQKYIPEGCDLMMVIFALNNSGFKLRHLTSDAFIASIVFRKGLISSSTLELVIKYQSGYTKIVTGRVMSISL